MVKFCTECAHPIIDGNMPFCPKCGAKLPINSPEVQPLANQPSAVQQPPQPSWYISPANSSSTSVQTLAPQSRDPTTENTTKKRSLGEWIAIICGGIILLVILSAFIAGMFSGMSVDNYKYCTDHFPGTAYDPLSKLCEPVIITKDLSLIALTLNDLPGWRAYDTNITHDSYSRKFIQLTQALEATTIYLDINRYSTIELAETAYNSKKAEISSKDQVTSVDIGNEGYGYTTIDSWIVVFREGNIIVRTQYGVGGFAWNLRSLSIDDAKNYAKIVAGRIK